MLFRDVPAHPHELTQRVALAAAEACREVAGVSPLLKWPNDLLLDGRKLAGVLAQSGWRPIERHGSGVRRRRHRAQRRLGAGGRSQARR